MKRSYEFEHDGEAIEYVVDRLSTFGWRRLWQIYRRMFKHGLAQSLRFQIVECIAQSEWDGIKTKADANRFINKELLGE